MSEAFAIILILTSSLVSYQHKGIFFFFLIFFLGGKKESACENDWI